MQTEETVTLRQHFERLLELRLEAVTDAFAAHKELHSAAETAHNITHSKDGEAIAEAKATVASHFVASNGLQEQMARQQATFSLREVTDKEVDRLQAQIDELKGAARQQVGRGQGMNALSSIMVTGVGVIATLVGMGLALLAFR